jgi:hypothetical protein
LDRRQILTTSTVDPDDAQATLTVKLKAAAAAMTTSGKKGQPEPDL